MRKNKNFKKLIIYTITALMVLSAISMVANAAYIQIGTGTSTEPYVPVYTYYDYGWSEELFLQTEIGQAIEIIGLQYYVSSYSGTFPHTINDCRCYISHTTQTSLTTTKPDSSLMTLVYSGGFTVYQLGWNTITFNVASFNYDNIDNLLIYWENWDGDYDYPYPYFQYTYTYPYRAVYDYQDGSMPDSGSTTSYLANIRLNFRCDHDVAVMDILSPDDAEAYGSVPVQVEVKNLGLNTETFPVNVKIKDLTAPKITLFSEDFTGVSYGYLPTGWTEDPPYSGSYHWGVYTYSNYAGGVSPELRFYYYPYDTQEFRCYTPAINTFGYSELELEFKHYLNQNYQPYTLKVETSTDALSWNTAWSISPSGDIPATTEHVLLDAGDGVGSSNLYISFTVDGYSYNAYYWYIDDVILQTPPPTVYDQTVLMSTLSVGSTSQADLPDWVIGTPGLYEVTAEAQLGTDGDYSNNIMTKITQVGLVDAALVSIDYPKALMGPAPFHPVATVENVGDLDFDIATVGQLPVHATVLDPSGGTGVCFQEDFEGSTAFYEYDGDVNVIFNPDEPQYKYGDLVGAPGYIEWVEKPLMAPGNWIILNPDNNGVRWHPTTYRSVSPTQSMYCGDENTKTYLPDSTDVMISPKVHVGAAGGSFGFSIFNDVEGGSTDYVYFGTSTDMNSWHWWWFGGAWWNNWQTYSGIPIYSTDVDANGDCYIGFAFFSNSAYEYEGVYIDDVQVQGSPYLYDETVLIDLPAGASDQVEFPLFNALPGYENYVLEVCCEHPEDNVPSNDCGSQAFNNNAPVYNLDTGLGYLTIQEGVNDAQEDQTVVVNDGTFYENVVLNRSIVLTGRNIQSTQDTATCTWDHDHGTFLVGTVDIVPVPEEAGGPCFCDYEICLFDAFGDGWNGNTIDVVVDGVIVYDDLTLVSGAGPECYTFTVQDGSSIEIIWNNGGSWMGEPYYDLYDSEGNLLADDWYPYYDGDWVGTATCPCDGGACTCDYQICLYDDYGDGWDTYYTSGPDTLDVIVDGTVVLDDITCYGYGPDCFTFTVEDGSTIQTVFYGPSYYPGECSFDIFDSTGAPVVTAWYPYYSGDWSGTATCPPCASFSDPEPGMAVLQKFDITPGVTFTEQEAAVFINRSNVLVQMNTIHNVEGAVDDNISAIEIFGDNSTEPLTNVIIENNTLYTVLNTGGSMSFARDTIFFDDFDSYPLDWTIDGTATCGYWDQLNFGTACGSTYHYIMIDDYKYHSAPYAPELYYNCPNDDWLTSPVISLAGYQNAELDFWYFWDDSWDIEFEVLIEDQANPNVWSSIKTYILPGTSPETWYNDVISISGYDGKDIRIAWRYTSNNEWAAYFDDILVTGEQGGPGPGPGGAECAAIGVFEHGFIEGAIVIDNRVEEIHSAGHSYGVDYAPENVAPATFQPATDWIQYCDDYTENGLGLTAGGTCCEAIQLTDTELANYRGMDICEIIVSIGCDAYGADSGIPYDVWISETQPTDPTTATVYATGTSDSSIWNTIDVDDYTIPASGDVWLGVIYTHPSGVYPMGFDTTNTNSRGGYLWDAPDGWLTLSGIGYPGVWGLSAGVCAGGGGGGASDIIVNCNYFRGIGDNSTYDVWADPLLAPYPGVMFKVEEPNVPGAGNASAVTLKCNYFDNECIDWIYAVENNDTENILDATLNYWGQVDGPDSDPILGDVQDPATGQIADGRGANIVLNGPVMFDPWLGVHAEIVEPMGMMASVEVGQPLTFDASCPDGSFGYCFPTCDECCEPEYQELQYLWDFDDGYYSSNKVAIHVFDQPGIYHVSLMVDTFGFPYHNNFMYDWAYIDVEVVPAGSPLDANADGEGLGEYETSIDSPVTLYGSATGGEAPYFYSWDFGDGTSTQTSSPAGNIATHKYAEPGTYTVTLTVIDMNGDRATDTSTVVVYGIEELVVSIGGNVKVSQGDSVTFTSSVSGGRSPYTYSWNFGDGIISNKAKPTHIYENSGIYTVTLTVTDNMGAEKTKTKTVTVSSTDTSEVEISNVKGGLLLKATIVSDMEVSWSIDVQGRVFFGGAADGTAQGVTQVKLPFTLAFGNVDIAITAGTEVKEYTAFAFGPLFFGLQEA